MQKISSLNHFYIKKFKRYFFILNYYKFYSRIDLILLFDLYRRYRRDNNKRELMMIFN